VGSALGAGGCVGAAIAIAVSVQGGGRPGGAPRTATGTPSEPTTVGSLKSGYSPQALVRSWQWVIYGERVRQGRDRFVQQVEDRVLNRLPQWFRQCLDLLPG
jgi:hypothetical protein